MMGDRFLNTIITTVQGCLARETLMEFEYGTVTMVNPLQIHVEDKPPITTEFLVLSELCKQKTVIIQGEIIELWPNLQKGDKVRMLRCRKGQLYFIVDRQP